MESMYCLKEHRFNISCIICMGDFIDPVLGSDGVIYCENCIKEWNAKHEVNPKDNGSRVTYWIKSPMLDRALLGSQVFTDLNLLKLIGNDIELDGEDDALKIMDMIDLENHHRIKEDRDRVIVLKNIFSNYKLIQQIMNLLYPSWEGVDGWNIAHYVVRFGTIELIVLMINNYDFDLNRPNNEKWYVVHFICSNSICLSSENQLKLIKLLFDPKKDINIDLNLQRDDDWHPIQSIVGNTNMTSSDCVQAIECLIKNNVNVEVIDSDGWNLLHLICSDSTPLDMKDRIKAINLVTKDKKININGMNDSKYTPLHFVCIERNADVNSDDYFNLIKILVDNGADVNICNDTMKSPLHLICSTVCNIDISCRLKIIELFMDHGANPLSVNHNNESPIHIVLDSKGYTSDEKIQIIKLFHPVKKIE